MMHGGFSFVILYSYFNPFIFYYIFANCRFNLFAYMVYSFFYDKFLLYIAMKIKR